MDRMTVVVGRTKDETVRLSQYPPLGVSTTILRCGARLQTILIAIRRKEGHKPLTRLFRLLQV